MIELTVCNYLKAQLQGTPVYMELPAAPPKKFVVLEKTGSSRTNYINSATFAVQSYDETLEKTAQLNETVKAAMDGLVELNEIGAVRLNSDYNFTNTATKKYRYQAVYVITYA